MAKKKIILGGDEYTLASSAYTLLSYKDFTGRDLLDDFVKLEKMENNTKTKDTGLITDTIKVMMDIFYVLYKDANEDAKSYKDFFSGIDNFLEEEEVMAEIMLLASQPFSRQLKRKQDKGK